MFKHLIHHHNFATDDNFLENHFLYYEFIFYVNYQMMDDSHAIQRPNLL